MLLEVEIAPFTKFKGFKNDKICPFKTESHMVSFQCILGLIYSNAPMPEADYKYHEIYNTSKKMNNSFKEESIKYMFVSIDTKYMEEIYNKIQ